MANIAVARGQLGQRHRRRRVKIDEPLRRDQRKMRGHEADEEHPGALVATRITQPPNRRLADRFVVGVVAGVAGTNFAKSYDVVSGSRNWIPHRSPHLSDSFVEMHGMMLSVDAGRIMAIDVVQLANGFDPHL